MRSACSAERCGLVLHARGLCQLHYDLWRRKNPAADQPLRNVRDTRENFWRRVDIMPSGCWEWTGSRRSDGYGKVVNEQVHRRAWRYLRGEPPVKPLVLDHLCRNRICVNVLHLEIVPERVNTLRGIGPSAVAARRDTCAAGHPYTEQTLRVYRGRRCCRTCHAAYMRRWNKQRKAAA